MTIVQKRKILQRIVDLEADIETLKKVRVSLATEPYVSASLASSGGSKSYTRLDISKITETIKELQTELKNVRSLLAGRDVRTPTTIATIYV